jgi:hypothetical protein
VAKHLQQEPKRHADLGATIDLSPPVTMLWALALFFEHRRDLYTGPKWTQSHDIGLRSIDETFTQEMHQVNESCPVPTPAERQYADIQDRAERAMLATIYKAIEDASRQAADDLRAIGSQETPPPRDYFAAVAHQKLFLLLCGADPETFMGGNAEIAAHIIDNGRKISEHYWVNKGVEPKPGDPSN